MPIKLTKKAVEQSSYIISVAFTDEKGKPMTPASLNWTLTNTAGQVCNSRSNVEVAVLSTQVDIALSGDDLVLAVGEKAGVRVLTVEGTYQSAVTGGELPFKESAHFGISNLVAVS